ncbi:hypothetical protein [Lacticaseibacillus paracasei]|uniref:hypothetical protein n=1 Tax=Lacticaseibacillus paracasei TaxID=1597 RepID=UPI001F506C40|nr:hypothetical protein [Lacticaseibacillus paracasei]MCI0372941.1 hypothetical protein [Lacticaseibacillus paracasei]MCI0374964.1 hypothetical protein [Lacticaseibacillus paracasei]MCP9380583.1 hypothetical protein [Lacticaseibacillus paracasei]
MLIKLDSGDYVNTDYIERLWMINEHDGFIRFVNAPDVPISENDRGRIVKAMKPKIEDGTDHGAMAFSPLINDHEVTNDEQ